MDWSKLQEIIELDNKYLEDHPEVRQQRADAMSARLRKREEEWEEEQRLERIAENEGLPQRLRRYNL